MRLRACVGGPQKLILRFARELGRAQLRDTSVSERVYKSHSACADEFSHCGHSIYIKVNLFLFSTFSVFSPLIAAYAVGNAGFMAVRARLSV